MLKFRSYLGWPIYLLSFCLAISGCRFAMPKPDYADKAINYLRSQLNITDPIAIESQQPLAVNTQDLCQTIFPTQDGWQISLISADTRYILQTDRNANQIEICRSEDAQPETAKNYLGAGFGLRYPADWQVIDWGLEPVGKNIVVFTPDREAVQTVQLEEDILLTKRKIQQNLEGRSQPYLMVLRQPKSSQDRAIAPSNPRNLEKNSKVLADENFIYTLTYYSPQGQSSAILEKSMGSFNLLMPIS